MPQQKVNSEFLKTTPTVWTFKESYRSEKNSAPILKWAWANFGDLRQCMDNVRKMTGRFPLSESPNNPELLVSFGHLMYEAVRQNDVKLYTFLEKDAGRCHIDVEYHHDNVDDLFVPMGWAKTVLELVGKHGVQRVFHDKKDGPRLYAHFEGTEMKREMVNPCRNRMGWKLDSFTSRL